MVGFPSFGDPGRLPLVVGPPRAPFGQPGIPPAPGGDLSIAGLLSGLGGGLGIALPALQTLGAAAQGGPSNAVSGGLNDKDFGDVQSANPLQQFTGSFSVSGRGGYASAGGQSPSAPADARGGTRTGGATGGLSGGNPNQAGPGVPGFFPAGVPAAAGARDDTLIYIALGGVALLAVLMVSRR